ncbi:hypothetical protein ON010_g2426 [Phytophthora cinnamomi]|nr:hypothetical protein ON010_g2426 [Phytophthora cinnamomi]
MDTVDPRETFRRMSGCIDASSGQHAPGSNARQAVARHDMRCQKAAMATRTAQNTIHTHLVRAIDTLAILRQASSSSVPKQQQGHLPAHLAGDIYFAATAPVAVLRCPITPPIHRACIEAAAKSTPRQPQGKLRFPTAHPFSAGGAHCDSESSFGKPTRSAQAICCLSLQIQLQLSPRHVGPEHSVPAPAARVRDCQELAQHQHAGGAGRRRGRARHHVPHGHLVPQHAQQVEHRQALLRVLRRAPAAAQVPQAVQAAARRCARPRAAARAGQVARGRLPAPPLPLRQQRDRGLVHEAREQQHHARAAGENPQGAARHHVRALRALRRVPHAHGAGQQLRGVRAPGGRQGTHPLDCGRPGDAEGVGAVSEGDKGAASAELPASSIGG